jgi:hypothetical protein
MEKSAFTRTYLLYIRVIMVIISVPLVEPLCQTVIGRIPVLEHAVSYTWAPATKSRSARL